MTASPFHRSWSRPWRAWKLTRKFPISYRQAYRLCVGTRPAPIIGHLPTFEDDE